MALPRSSLSKDRRALRREDLSDQHPDVARIIEPTLDDDDEEGGLLATVGIALAQRRKDAVTARTSSGIESVWERCEEAYVGIDDANRAEWQTARWAKPMSSDGPVTTGRPPASGMINVKSTIFIRLTARYVDAGFAKLAEILLPADDKAFSFTETPVPALVDATHDARHVHDEKTGAPLFRNLMPGETPPGAPPPTAPAAGAAPGGMTGGATTAGTGAAAPAPDMMPAGGGVANAAPPPVPGQTPPLPASAGQTPLLVKDLAEENIQLARKKAKKAEARIYDWMVQTSYRAETRKTLFDAARLGVGVLKGPVPEIQEMMATTKGEDGSLSVEFRSVVVPASRQVSPWNFFPDPTCGENIQNGNYVFERDTISEKQLDELRKEPGYISSQIDRCILQGPGGSKIVAREQGDPESLRATSLVAKEKYEIWYYHGTVRAEELDAFMQAADPKRRSEDELDGKRLIPVIATMVNDLVIKMTPAPLGSGKFPYNTFPWTRRAAHWAGIGIAEQLFAPQRMLNAATRSMMNNAGKSAGSQIVIDQACIRPADGQWIVTPDKIWFKTMDSATQAVEDAFQLFKIPNVTTELMTIVNYALQVAEESTSIPLITQGQTGPTTPETLGATQIQNSNANQLLRAIGYSFDDHITEPLVKMYYEWYLMDPEVPDEDKGDFQINAHGSVAMVERAIQDMVIAQMGNVVTNPIYGLDPKRWAKQMIKSKKMDPADFSYTPAEQARIDAMPPPEDPRVTAARVTMEGWQAEAKIKGQTDIEKVDKQAQVDMAELNMKRELALLQYANQHKITIAQVQAQLAETAMKLKTQERLNMADNMHAAAQHGDKMHVERQKMGAKPTSTMRPPVQAPGRAGRGNAFSQAGGSA